MNWNFILLVATLLVSMGFGIATQGAAMARRTRWLLVFGLINTIGPAIILGIIVSDIKKTADSALTPAGGFKIMKSVTSQNLEENHEGHAR